MLMARWDMHVSKAAPRHIFIDRMRGFETLGNAMRFHVAVMGAFFHEAVRKYQLFLMYVLILRDDLEVYF